MKARELRDLTDDELAQRMNERMDFMMSFNIQVATGVVDNVRAARNARRDIARIKTIQKERELQAAKGRVQA